MNHGRTQGHDGPSFEFIVYGKPQPKMRPKAARRGNFIKVYTPKKSLDYEARVGLWAKQERPKEWPKDAHYDVEIVAFPSTHKLFDIDNLAKSILDGMNEVVWDDDSQVVDLRVSRAWCPDVTTATKKADLISVALDVCALDLDELQNFNRGQLYGLVRNQLDKDARVWVRVSIVEFTKEMMAGK